VTVNETDGRGECTVGGMNRAVREVVVVVVVVVGRLTI